MNKILEKIKSFFKTNYEIINPTAVLGIICIAVTLALSSANLLTADKIEKLSEQTEKESMSKVLAGEYTEVTENLDGSEVIYYKAEKDGETVGYIFTVDTKGYGGTVSVMTGINADGTVANVEILSADDETPGLGQNVTKEKFYSQFSGLKNGISVKRSGTANRDNNEIDAVTGATISSKAVTTAVNTALQYAEQIIAKGDVS